MAAPLVASGPVQRGATPTRRGQPGRREAPSGPSPRAGLASPPASSGATRGRATRPPASSGATRGRAARPPQAPAGALRLRTARAAPVAALVVRQAPAGRLGVVWAASLLAASAFDSALVAVVVAPVACVAAGSLARASRRGRRGVFTAALGASVVPFVAIAGPAGAGAALACSAVAAAAEAGFRASPARAAIAVAGPAASAASLVVAARAPAGVALCLAAAICLFDLANYVVGTGSSGGVLGALAGLVTVGVFAVLIAAVVNPPFSGLRPWILCGLVGGLAPVGVRVGRRLAPGANLPALRRLDSLLLAGPAWVIASLVLLP